MIKAFLEMVIQKTEYEWRKTWNHESYTLHSKCNHRLLQRMPRGLICCINCRRTFQMHFYMNEIKLNKIEFQELIALMPDKWEGKPFT